VAINPKEKAMRIRTLATTLVAANALTVGAASAADRSDFRDPPRGAGTEVGVSRSYYPVRVHEGTQIAGFLGVGYGVGVGGRLGYAFASGVYAGGSFTFFEGNASFLGGELGYKFFPGYRWELQPYIFAGPAFVRVGDSGFGRPDAATVLAVQPGLLGAYHFGTAFISAEMRGYIAPNPGALAFLGGLGVAL
jgi:hypothetical protein